jgi:caffeoyl-CoA O-methyltransferase
VSQRPLRPVTPVGLLVERLDEIAVLIRGADPLVRERVREARALADGLEPYLAASTTPESADLADLARRTQAYAFPESGTLEAEMLSGHVEGQLLQVLVRATRARRVLEIGMFTGYSALAMAEALPDDGEVVACEIDPGVAAFAAERLATAEHGAKVRIEVGPAVDTLARLAAEGATYDLVFVDADKPGYAAYLDAVLDGDLLAPHGLVCVDNTLLQGAAYGAGPETDNSRAIAAFNAKVAADPRVQQVLVPLRDGVTLITRLPAPTEAPG